MLFAILLRKVIHSGRLTMIDAHGRRHEFGTGDHDQNVTIQLHDASLHWKLALNPRLMMGEAYMSGGLTVEDGKNIYDFLDLLLKNIGRTPFSGLDRISTYWRMTCRRIAQANPVGRAKTNVAHHYDLSSKLYEMFLDSRRQYSCAYFARPDLSLAEAQLAKLNHIAAKLRIEPGQTVLDIGCGWGGLAMHLAEHYGAEVTGITLSDEQHAYAVEKAAERGLSGRVAFHLRDYRDERGTYDRVVSVGMFEHVGAPNYDTFFRCVRDRLTAAGVALIHTIVQMNAPRPTNPWLAKYIFPGGYCPAPSEVLESIERALLWADDMECLRLHYAETLRHWRAAFMERWEEAKSLYDERFCRMWEFYLAGSELGFRRDGHMVIQFQLSREQEAVPLTRDYLYPPGDQAGEATVSYRPRRVA
jgi:cyclopropane-fatty-acyl-phospholipid synthase